MPHNNSMKKPIDELFFLNKLCRFCAYQERSEKEVRNKLKLLECPIDWQEDVVNALKANGFLNEERFIKAFAAGKQNMKSWGKQKILFKLLEKGISRTIAENAVQDLQQDDYLNTLKTLMVKKWQQLERQRKDLPKSRLIRFVLGKGYSYEDILITMNKLGIKEKPSH